MCKYKNANRRKEKYSKIYCFPVIISNKIYYTLKGKFSSSPLIVWGTVGCVKTNDDKHHCLYFLSKQ